MAAMPTTAMVFAAGLGTRMRPITDALPKPLVKVARAHADRSLPRPLRRRRRRAGDRQRPLAARSDRGASGGPPTAADRISDEREKLLDQGGGIKRALPLLGREPFLICNTDAFWIEGPRSNLKRLAEAFDPKSMDILLLVAASAGAVGVDWPGDFTMTREGRLEPREPRHVAPFVYAGVGIVKPELFDGVAEDVFNWRRSSSARRSGGACSGCGSTGSGCMSAGPRRSRRPNARSTGR